MRQLLTVMLLLLLASGLTFAAGGREAADPDGVPTVTFFTMGVPEGEVALRMLAEAEEEVGVRVEFEEPPQQNYAERLQIMLASGDYPDVIFFPSKDQILIEAAASGVLRPINEYLQNAPNVWEHSLPESWVSMQLLADGDIYTIPRNTVARKDGYAVRRDWLENLGLEWPADNAVTLDEFTEWIRAFTEDDPNRSGRSDTRGLFLHTADDGRFGVYGANNTPLYWPFGITGWQKYGDEYMNLMYSRDRTNMKEALAYMNRIYEAGYINDDAVVVRRNPSARELFVQGRVGMYNEFGGHVAGLGPDVQEFDPNARIDYLVGIKNADGVVEGGSYGTGTWGYYGIASTSRHPQKVIDFFDWAFGAGWDRIKWGYEGITYEEAADGTRLRWRIPKSSDEIPPGWWGSFVRRAGDVEYFVTQRQGEEQIRAYENISAARDAFVVSLDIGYVPEAARNQRFIEADDELYETIGRIVIGELPVSAYDAALDNWYRNGGAEYVREMQAYIVSVWEN